MTQEHFGTGSKKGRGMAQKSIGLIGAMREIAAATVEDQIDIEDIIARGER